MQRGFVLIELLISMVISSIVMIVFITAFNQIQKTASSLEKTMLLDNKAALFQMIFENDISGAFVPTVQQLIFSEEDDYQEKMEKVFYEERENDQVSELSFVTCNSLNASMKFKPRIARIFYFFRDDLDNRGSKIFYRQQNKKEIEYGFAKDDDSKYEVMDGIKSIKLEYVFEKDASDKDLDEESDKKGKKKSSNKSEEDEKPQKIGSVKKSYKLLKELKSDKESDEVKLPTFVIAKLELWQDIREKRYIEYLFKFQIYAASYIIPPLTMPSDKSKQKEEPKSDENNKPEAGVLPTSVPKVTKVPELPEHMKLLPPFPEIPKGVAR